MSNFDDPQIYSDYLPYEVHTPATFEIDDLILILLLQQALFKILMTPKYHQIISPLISIP